MTCTRHQKWEAWLVVDKIDCWKSLHNNIRGARLAAGKEDSVVRVFIEEQERIKYGRKAKKNEQSPKS